jgi:2,3-dimethylmalate lyase
VTRHPETASPCRPAWAEVLRTSTPLVLPGAYDALSARLIQESGFSAAIVGGYSLVASRFGLPDLGLVGLEGMAEAVRPIVASVRIPILMDGDTGYGEERNVVRTVRTYESMGVAALLLEDQVAPKRCGHMAGKAVIPTEMMVSKLQAAVAARVNPEFFILARTDARATLGLDEALRRGEQYLRAGADGLFIEAPESIAELRRIGTAFDVPQACNMLVGGRTPILSAADLSEMGFQMVFHATDLIMRAAKVLRTTLHALSAGILESPDVFDDFAAFQDTLGISDWRVWDSHT